MTERITTLVDTENPEALGDYLSSAFTIKDVKHTTKQEPKKPTPIDTTKLNPKPNDAGYIRYLPITYNLGNKKPSQNAINELKKKITEYGADIIPLSTQEEKRNPELGIYMPLLEALGDKYELKKVNGVNGNDKKDGYVHHTFTGSKRGAIKGENSGQIGFYVIAKKSIEVNVEFDTAVFEADSLLKKITNSTNKGAIIATITAKKNNQSVKTRIATLHKATRSRKAQLRQGINIDLAMEKGLSKKLHPTFNDLAEVATSTNIKSGDFNTRFAHDNKGNWGSSFANMYKSVSANNQLYLNNYANKIKDGIDVPTHLSNDCSDFSIYNPTDLKEDSSRPGFSKAGIVDNVLVQAPGSVTNTMQSEIIAENGDSDHRPVVSVFDIQTSDNSELEKFNRTKAWLEFSFRNIILHFSEDKDPDTNPILKELRHAEFENDEEYLRAFYIYFSQVRKELNAMLVFESIESSNTKELANTLNDLCLDATAKAGTIFGDRRNFINNKSLDETKINTNHIVEYQVKKLKKSAHMKKFQQLTHSYKNRSYFSILLSIITGRVRIYSLLTETRAVRKSEEIVTSNTYSLFSRPRPKSANFAESEIKQLNAQKTEPKNKSQSFRAF